MSLIGNNWKEELSSEEKYEEITGEKSDDVNKDIEKKLENLYISRVEKEKLQELQQELLSKL